jgi:hypothetical protein
MEWYFYTREGVLGPFTNEKQAEKEMEVFVNLNIKNNDDGGRNTKEMRLEPINKSNSNRHEN